MNDELLNRILVHEGFRTKAYPDPLSGAEPFTFGHGLTYITEDESIEIVKNRLQTIANSLDNIYPWARELEPAAHGVLIEMAFQMGVTGLGKFKLFLSALHVGDYREAAKQMLDSRWAKQTPARAAELSHIIRGLH